VKSTSQEEKEKEIVKNKEKLQKINNTNMGS